MDILLILVLLQSVAFLRLLWAFTDPLDIQRRGSRYKSIVTQCVVLPVKFEDGLSIFILRNKRFFPENWISNFLIFTQIFGLALYAGVSKWLGVLDLQVEESCGCGQPPPPLTQWRYLIGQFRFTMCLKTQKKVQPCRRRFAPGTAHRSQHNGLQRMIFLPMD
jgi:hypothetical protein